MKKRGRKKKIKDVPQKPLAAAKTLRSDLDDFDETAEIETKIKIEVEEYQGPETGQEPAGPDQSLPISSDMCPPIERKATSYINVVSESVLPEKSDFISLQNNTASTKLIPRLVDNSGSSCDSSELCPEEWNIFDVAQFLRVNDCANYCDSFSRQVSI